MQELYSNNKTSLLWEVKMKYITFEDNTPCLMELARLTKGTFKVDYADKDNPTLSIPSSSPFKIPLGETIMVDENGHVYLKLL